MAYRFKLGESISNGFKRNALAQIDLAVRELSDVSDIHRGVHETRKSLKRLRALLRLVRPVLPKRAFRRENRALRDIARTLAGARDIQVLTTTIGQLRQRARSKPVRSVLDAAKRQLESRRPAAEEQLGAAVNVAAVASLEEVRSRLEKIELAGDGFPAISRGLGASYDAARMRAFAPAMSLSEEAYHEWRKFVQQHWRHMQLVSQAWPEELGARVVAARELSELLGQDHDLALLRDLLERDSRRYGKERAVEETVQLIVSEQGRLRALALPMARRLFAEPTASFVQRMRQYWKTSRRLRKALKKSS